MRRAVFLEGCACLLQEHVGELTAVLRSVPDLHQPEQRRLKWVRMFEFVHLHRGLLGVVLSGEGTFGCGKPSRA